MRIEGHELWSNTSSGGCFSYDSAQCECGEELGWYTREQDHERHLLAVVWKQGYDTAFKFLSAPWAYDHPNPYEGEDR